MKPCPSNSNPVTVHPAAVRATFVGWPTLLARVGINLAAEVATDVTKNTIFARFFGALPPVSAHSALTILDVALVSVVSLNAYGLILAGMLIADPAW